MGTPFRWLLLVLFVLVNGVIVYWAWQQVTDPAGPDPISKAAAQRSGSEEFGRTESLAYDLIEKWNREPAIALGSEDLPSAVESLPEAGCIGLPSGAVAIESRSLPASVKQDLDTAVIGLLQAYRDGKPDSVINYMRGRGQTISGNFRKFVERALLNRGVADPEKLSDEDQYRAMWTTFQSNAHWSGLVADSSCRQFWDGKKVLPARLRFDINSAPNTPPGQLEQAAYLFRLLRGTSTPRHNFVSTAGSLQDSHRDDPSVLLCDVQLVIELDDSFSRVKVPYLIRFWFNNALEKWRPVAMECFTASPEGGRLPSLQF